MMNQINDYTGRSYKETSGSYSDDYERIAPLLIYKAKRSTRISLYDVCFIFILEQLSTSHFCF
jgi:hypothetical protein